jgi:hypothetical protein
MIALFYLAIGSAEHWLFVRLGGKGQFKETLAIVGYLCIWDLVVSPVYLLMGVIQNSSGVIEFYEVFTVLRFLLKVLVYAVMMVQLTLACEQVHQLERGKAAIGGIITTGIVVSLEALGAVLGFIFIVMLMQNDALLH